MLDKQYFSRNSVRQLNGSVLSLCIYALKIGDNMT